MKFIRTFEEFNDEGLGPAGAKGASLVKMRRAGLPVPPGFVILSTAFDKFMQAAAIDSRVERLHAEDDVRALILNADIPDEIEQEIKAAFADLRWDKVAVRSSAGAEDGPEAAWAGQLESFLNTTGKTLLPNVKKCWASLFSPRALAYRLEKGFGQADISVAVVVQRMVAAEVSGVAFSANPINSSRNEMVIEAAPGLGEDLVSGRVNPDRYIIAKPGLTLLHKHLESRRSDGPAESDGRPPARLSDREVRELCSLVMEIESLYGHPVDIEWAKDRSLWVTQCRPITTLKKPPTADKYVWSNLNVAEVLPGVVPPLVATLYIDLLQPAVRNIKIFDLPKDIPLITSIKGRMYFNVTAFEKGFFKNLTNDSLNVTKLLGGEQPQSEILSAIPLRAKLKLGAFGARMLMSSLFFQRQLDRFFTEVDAVAGQLNSRLARADHIDDQLRIMQEAMKVIARFAEGNFKMLAFPAAFFFLFVSAADKWLPGDTIVIRHKLLSGGGRGLHEIEAFCLLWEIRDGLAKHPLMVSRFLEADSIEAALAVLKRSPALYHKYHLFLEQHGHRCAHELDFSKPRWLEDQSFIIDTLKNYLNAPAGYDPAKRREAVRLEQKKLLASIDKQLPRWKSAALRNLLRLAITGQRQRERIKYEIIKLLLPLRSALLKIGGELEKNKLLEKAEDIFMFEAHELLSLSGLAEATGELFGRISGRKHAYRRYARTEIPAVITDVDNIPVPNKSETADGPIELLKGIAVSHGLVEGTARVINNVEDIGRLRPDDILVTDHTDPGWTPVFATIKGIVTNTGGLISHASIVAREYGLPAVVNVPRATELIGDGARVRLDADRGTVRILGGARADEPAAEAVPTGR